MRKFKILAFVFVCLFSLNVNAVNMYREGETNKEKGYKEPIYSYFTIEKFFSDEFKMEVLAESDNFPFSSRKQGSIFYKIFNDLAEKEHILIWLRYAPKDDFKKVETEFEHGVNKLEIDGLFGMYYEEKKYALTKYLYPSFAENKIHLITASNKTLDVATKDDLKKYKGLYIKEDFLPEFVKKDAKRLGMTEVDSFDRAFEDVLTGKVDYIIASNYESQIELYKRGLRNYVKYSQNPIWVAQIFLRLPPHLLKHPRIEYLKRYFKSNEYKQYRDAMFEELLSIYKENTKGVVPPTYTQSYQSLISK
ncbi:MAG: hypothetical protein IKW58_03410 [Alphaproteobacteria bacterium]|nr:hypothetical protein [Alphaproteobacteria bacterium]